MSARFLLDTNALSEPLKPSPDPTFLAHLAEHRARVVIASVTWHEALFGLGRLPQGKRRDAIARFLFQVVRPSVPILPYDAEAADWHARERARLSAAGRTVGFADGQIAAVAKTRDLVLVTANVADFQPFEGLQVVTWKGDQPA